MLFGPLAILISWIGFFLIYFRRDKEGPTTISDLAYASRLGYWIFLVGFITSGVFMFLFFKLWLVKKLALPSVFLWMVGIATLILQPIVAIVPMGGGIKSITHNVAAHIEGVLLMPMALLIATSDKLGTLPKIICWVSLAFMIYLIREFQRNLSKPRFIKIQALYAASFHLIILLSLTATLGN